MKEDFLHYIWQYKKMDVLHLATPEGEPIVINYIGEKNTNAGPDFFNAQLIIGAQKWAGNVEIHVKSSDWYVHSHELDSNYDNVILHVVWEYDVDVFRKDNTKIPILELKSRVDVSLLSNYSNLVLATHKWINCETQLVTLGAFVLDNWLERLYIERLEEKSKLITQLLDQTQNNWEAVLFWLLAKNFGLKINGDAFMSVARSFDFSIIRKQSSVISIEALLFGQSKLLDENIEEHYYNTLKKEYSFLKTKFSIDNTGIAKPMFFRLRPANFPTIRLSQLANLYAKEVGLFSRVITISTLESFYDLFSVETSPFWETHFTFGKISKKQKKKLSKDFIDLLLINTIIPLRFAYAKSVGKSINEDVFLMLQNMKSEKNSIVDKFMALNNFKDSALTSQAVLQLKNKYCDHNKCMDCAIGNKIMAS